MNYYIKGILNCLVNGNFTVYAGSTEAKKLEIIRGYHLNKLVISENEGNSQLN